MADGIRAKLVAGLAPTVLDVIDDSDRHAGHAGASSGGESHFRVIVEAAAFAGLRSIQRQRLVYGLLGEELAGPVHALSLVTRAPGEG